MIWDILEAKIEAAGLAKSGVSMFRQFMPADVKVGIMFKAPLTGIEIDPYLPGYYKPTLQVIVRHTHPQQGEKLANAVMETLTVEGPEFHEATEEHGRVQIIRFYPRELPIRYPRLDGNSLEWSLNFSAIFVISK